MDLNLLITSKGKKMRSNLLKFKCLYLSQLAHHCNGIKAF